MKTSMSLETVLETARTIENRAVDYIAPVGRLGMKHHTNYIHTYISDAMGVERSETPDALVLQLNTTNGAVDGELTDSAFRQLCTKLRIPSQYAEMLRDEEIPSEVGDEWSLDTGRGMVTKLSRKTYPKATPLLSGMINHGLRNGDQNIYRMLRGLLPEETDGTQKWRAILSNQYLPIPSVSILDRAMMHCNNLYKSNGYRAELKSAEVNEDRLYAKFIFPDMVSRALRTRRQNDIVQIGFVLYNNEIGSGSYGVRSFVEFLACTNGMILPKWSTNLTKVHRTGRIEMDGDIVVSSETRRAQIEASLSELSDMINTVIAPERLERLTKAVEYAASSPDIADAHIQKTVQKIAKAEVLSETESNAVYQAFIRGNDLGQFGMSQAICSNDVARTLSFERATHLETVAGKVLTMDRGEWSRLAVAA